MADGSIQTNTMHLIRRFIVLCIFLVLILSLNFFVYNGLIGLVLNYLNVVHHTNLAFDSSHLQWHGLSPVLLMIFVILIVIGALIKAWHYRLNSQSIASYYGARPINQDQAVPEEIALYACNIKMAQRCKITPAQVYILDKELGINALTIGYRQHELALMVTWGAVQSLTYEELSGILAHQYSHIVQRSYIFKTIIEISLSGCLWVSLLGTRLVIHGISPAFYRWQYSYKTMAIVLGGLLWLIGSLAVWMSRLLKWHLFAGKEWQVDYIAQALTSDTGLVGALQRIEQHPYGSHLYHVEAETLSHYCFANPLSQRHGLQLWQPLQQRIFNLIDATDVYQHYHHPIYHKVERFFSILFLPTQEKRILDYLNEQHQQRELPIPSLYTQIVDPLQLDQMRALSEEVRAAIERPDIIQRALTTASSCRELIMALFVVRQYDRLEPAHIAVSHALLDSLNALDRRVDVQLFREALSQLDQMPALIGKLYLSRLEAILQSDGVINLLDVLLLDHLKAQQNLLISADPHRLVEVNASLVHVIDALLALPAAYAEHIALKYQLRTTLLKQFNIHVVDYPQTDQIFDLSHDLSILASVLPRERLTILHHIERLLWLEHPISQEQLDAIELLYWRFGFDGKATAKRLIQQSQTLF